LILLKVKNIYLIFIFIVRSKDDKRRIMQLLQFAEPIEKSKVIYFDRRPESSRPVNQTNQFPKILYDKNAKINTLKSTNIKKYSTYNKKVTIIKKMILLDHIGNHRLKPNKL
jgi:hypothetical protein